MPHYSRFWLAFGNGAPLAPIWAWRDKGDSPIGESLVDSPIGEIRDVAEFAPAHQLDALPMGTWLRLSEAERADVVVAYAKRRPAARASSSDAVRVRQKRGVARVKM